MGIAATVFAAAAAALMAGGRPNPIAARLGRQLGVSVRDSSRSAGPGPEWPVSRRSWMSSGSVGEVGLGSAGLRVLALRLAALPGWGRSMAGSLVGAVAGWLLAAPAGPIVGAVCVPAAIALDDRRRSRQASRRRTGEVVDGCLALAGELGAGAPPHHALSVVAGDWPGLFALASRQALVGGDPATALRESARQPGAEALRAVAAAWEVSERTGARLSTVLAAVADSLRAEAAVRKEADAQLASVRATARLMAVLPVLTLALFSAGDGAAVGFLIGTPHGVLCLLLAAVFIAMGLLWVDRASRVRQSAWT